MTLTLKHFDTRLNEWIKDASHPSGILTEQLENTLLETYFPNVEFSFGHLDQHTTADDLYNHPDGDVLLFSSKTRLLYGPKECLETIEKLCPDRKDRGAYAAASWHLCHAARDSKFQLQVGNFVYSAFGEEVRRQLEEFQLKELTITGLQKSHNQVKEEVGNQGQTLNLEVKVRDDLPVTDERYGKKLLFVEGQEMAVVSNRDAELPVGSCFQGTIKADNIATANLQISGVDTPIKFGKVNHFDYAGHHFRGEKSKTLLFILWRL